jgi:hypothetical protein
MVLFNAWESLSIFSESVSMDVVKFSVSVLGGSTGKLVEGEDALVSGHDGCATIVLDRHIDVNKPISSRVSVLPCLLILP